VLEQVWVERAAQSEEFFMANLTLSFAAALTFMWAADFKSVVEGPRMESVSTLSQNSSTSGTLMPGGSWTSEDGVVIHAPNGVISSPIQVFVEKVKPVSIEIPIPDGISIAGSFFRVGASKRTDTDESFEIKLPIAEGDSSTDLLVMILITAGSLTDIDLPDDQLIWYITTLDGLESNKAIVKDSLLLKEGTIYVLVRYSNVFPKTLVAGGDTAPPAR
jgi:hypothetical protein